MQWRNKDSHVYGSAGRSGEMTILMEVGVVDMTMVMEVGVADTLGI